MASTELTYEEYKAMVEERGQIILDIMASIATGNLDQIEVDIPPGDDVLGDISIGLSFIVDDFRALLAAQEQARRDLEEKVAERTAELEAALQEIQATQRRYIHQEWDTYAPDEPDSTPLVLDDELAALVETAVAQNQLATQTNGHAALAVPINYADELIGVLGVRGEPEQSWAEDDLTAVLAIAEQVGLALENQRLFDQTQQALAQTENQANRLSQLNEMGTDLQTAQDLHSILSVTGRYVYQIFHNSQTSIAIQRDNAPHLDVYIMTEDGQVEYTTSAYNIDHTALGIAMRTQLPQRLDYDPDSEFADIRDLSREGLQSFMNAPLATRGRVIGTINVRSHQRHHFDITDENLLQQMAALIASNIESRQLLAEAQRQAQRERLVNDITQKIQGAVTIESALQVAIQELGQALQARYTEVELNAS